MVELLVNNTKYYLLENNSMLAIVQPTRQSFSGILRPMYTSLHSFYTKTTEYSRICT